MSELYVASFPKGSKVRVRPNHALQSFYRDWKYHHKLRPEQLEYAGTTAVVEDVSFYHGGDQLYVLEGVPGIWHGACLETMS